MDEMNTQEENKETGENSVEYKCALCHYSTKLHQQLKRHMTTHSNDKLFKCCECPYRAKQKGCVTTHLKLIHSDPFQLFPCPESGCNYAAKMKNKLKRHSKIHTDEKPFSCSHPNCNFSTNRKSNLVVHTRVHTGEKPYVCQFESCSYTTAEKSQLVTHTRKHTGETPYKCTEANCNFSTANSATLKRHQLTHEPKEGEERPSFSCSLCEYSGKSKELLSKHVNYKHVLLKSIACPVDSCKFRCSRKGSLVNHLRSIHSDEKQYKCELCPFRAKVRNNVRIHLNGVHADPNLKPFKCPEAKCDFTSKTKSHLKAHLLTHNTEKKYACSFPDCDFKAVTKVQVNRHEYNIHSEEKKEKCLICDYKCKMKYELAIHMRTHTKEEPYKCKEIGCEYRAKQFSNFRQHQNKHHPHIFKQEK